MFTIQCTTCSAKLAVKSDELIGQILACPKCGGMVLVERPSDEAAVPPSDDTTSVYKKFPDAFYSETASGIINQERYDEKGASAGISSAQTSVLEAVPESERKLRKRLLQFLAGLLLCLVVAVGCLIAFKGMESSSKPDDSRQRTEIELQTDDFDPDESATQDEQDDKAEHVAERREEKISPPQTASAPVFESDRTKGESPDDSTIPPSIAQEDKKDNLAELLLPPKKEDIASTAEQGFSVPATEQSGEDSDKKEELPNDLLSNIQKKLPGLVDSSAVLTLDISERLSQRIVGIKLTETPLISVLRSISELMEIPITIDVDELFCRDIAIDRPISLEIKEKTFGDLLTEILAPLELEPIVEDQQILISVSPDQRDRILERRFDVSDLVLQTKDAVDLRGRPVPDGQLTTEKLANILRHLVDPVAFVRSGQEKDNGGGAELQTDGSTLIVRHCRRMLTRSQRILEQLRVLRNLPLKTELNEENLVPEAFGWDAVERPLTLNYYQPTPLAGVLMQIESATNIRILVDHRGLHRALTPVNTIHATVRCNRGTVNEALERLFASVDIALLDYRIVGSDFLEVSTQDVLRRADKMTVEIHRYETPEALLEEAETPENLVRLIRASLEPESWNDEDDRSATPENRLSKGWIFIDRPSGCLFVRQSQPIQRQLRLWLGKKLASKNPAEAAPVSSGKNTANLN